MAKDKATSHPYVVTNAEFWELHFTGELRVGPYRIAPCNRIWAVLADGEPSPLEPFFGSQQEAVDDCVARIIDDANAR